MIVATVLGALLANVSSATSLTDAIAAPLARLFAGDAEGISSPGGSFLPPDEAFSLSYPEITAVDTLVLRWRIADGYYLYRDQFRFESAGDPVVTLGDARIPRGIIREEADGSGTVELLSGDTAIILPLTFRHAPAAEAGDAPDLSRGERILKITVSYQGCAEAGFCYPPISRPVRVALPPDRPKRPDG
uniref:Disulphide bond corrector protein DsbC n=1 Tax=Candidatus Kentrum sp. DK TaxID=2126562 RepID=A0A450T975_9GAMM|nr:MAG: Disulphide bond corrector protein DsbC [Candidatus Kentron sp. DK]VFJ64297.1 MAG: Disulphide bond corrector protein DsbC [Candidatus Kentron sp. DK]